MWLLSKLTPKTWQERPPYGAIALIIAAIIFLASGYYYDNGYVSRVLTAVATASMGVWVTLEVVQWVLKKDREDRIAYFEAATYGLFADSIVDILISAAGAILVNKELFMVHLKEGGIKYISADFFDFLLDITEKVVTADIKLDALAPFQLCLFYSFAEYSLITLSDKMPIRIMAIEDKNLIQNTAEVEMRIATARNLRNIHQRLTKLDEEAIAESKKISESDVLRAVEEIKLIMIACCELYLTILLRIDIDPLDARKKLDHIEEIANYSKGLQKRHQ